jgi:hypothetical protein
MSETTKDRVLWLAKRLSWMDLVGDDEALQSDDVLSAAWEDSHPKARKRTLKVAGAFVALFDRGFTPAAPVDEEAVAKLSALMAEFKEFAVQSGGAYSGRLYKRVYDALVEHRDALARRPLPSEPTWEAPVEERHSMRSAAMASLIEIARAAKGDGDGRDWMRVGAEVQSLIDALATEESMHRAWRKRAEEAEASLPRPRAEATDRIGSWPVGWTEGLFAELQKAVNAAEGCGCDNPSAHAECLSTVFEVAAGYVRASTGGGR